MTATLMRLALVLSVTSFAFGQDDADLIKAADAQRPIAPAAQAVDADDAEIAAAQLELRVAHTKLLLAKARKELSEKRFEGAARLAQRALVQLKPVGERQDVSAFELQAEGILARCAKHGVKPLAVTNVASDTADEFSGDVAAAAVVGSRYSGPQRAEVRADASQDRLRRLAEGRAQGDEGELRPGAALIDRQAVLAQDEQRLQYTGALRDLIDADEARLLTAADEARIVPEGDVTFPGDWPAKVERRKKYAGGLIAQSKSWKDDTGREWYVGIYDIADLTLVPPNFQPAASIDIVENLRNERDREALRLRSGIFNSYNPADIASGIQLLRYFGGLDDPFGPRYSLQRQEQVIEMLRAINAPESDAKIIALPPVEGD